MYSTSGGSSSSHEFVNSKIRDQDCVVFATRDCANCQKAKRILDEAGQKYEWVDLEGHHDKESIKNALNEIAGRRELPVIFCHGQPLGGERELEELQRSGKLEEKFKERGSGYGKAGSASLGGMHASGAVGVSGRKSPEKSGRKSPEKSGGGSSFATSSGTKAKAGASSGGDSKSPEKAHASATGSSGQAQAQAKSTSLHKGPEAAETHAVTGEHFPRKEEAHGESAYGREGREPVHERGERGMGSQGVPGESYEARERRERGKGQPSGAVPPSVQ
jgi:glutaredoxin 3